MGDRFNVTMAHIRNLGTLQPCHAAATLPPELWQQVWDSLDKGFFPVGGHPEIHMPGACKCGKLKFPVDGTLAASFLCHCHMCRKYWSQMCPTHTLWVQPATAVSVTSGSEHVKSWTVEKLSRNLRGQANVNFCGLITSTSTNGATHPAKVTKLAMETSKCSVL